MRRKRGASPSDPGFAEGETEAQGKDMGEQAQAPLHSHCTNNSRVEPILSSVMYQTNIC